MFGMFMSCPPSTRPPLRTLAASQARKTLLTPTCRNNNNLAVLHNSGRSYSIDISEGGPLEDSLGVVSYLRDGLDQAAQYFPPTPTDGICDTFGVFSHLAREMYSTGAYYPSSATRKDVVKPREFDIPPYTPIIIGPASVSNFVTTPLDAQSDFQPYPHGHNRIYISHKHTHSAPRSSITTSSGSGSSTWSSNQYIHSPSIRYLPVSTDNGSNDHFFTKPTALPTFSPEKSQTTISSHGYLDWYDTPGTRKDFSFNGPSPPAEVKAEMTQVAPDELEPTPDQVLQWIYAQEADTLATTAAAATTNLAAPILAPEESGRYRFSFKAVRHSLGHAIGELLKFAIEAVVGKGGNQARLDAGQVPWCYEREMEETFDDMGQRHWERCDSEISSKSSNSTEYWSGRTSNTYVSDQNWTAKRTSDTEFDECLESDGGVSVDC